MHGVKRNSSEICLLSIIYTFQSKQNGFFLFAQPTETKFVLNKKIKYKDKYLLLKKISM